MNPRELAIWQSEILRQMKSVTFEQSSAHVWEEKKRSHLLFLLWSRLPPTPSLESLPQIASAQAFITQLKLSYCSWHSERTTTSAHNNSSLPFLPEEFMEKWAITPLMTMWYSNVDNRLCRVGFWQQELFVGEKKASLRNKVIILRILKAIYKYSKPVLQQLFWLGAAVQSLN